MSYRSAASVAFPGCCYCKAFSLRMQKERSVRLLLKGLVGMALAWLVIGFGMELLFLADRVHPALRVIVGLGMLFLLIMIAGGMCRSLLSRKKTSWRSCLRRYICGGGWCPFYDYSEKCIYLSRHVQRPASDRNITFTQLLWKLIFRSYTGHGLAMISASCYQWLSLPFLISLYPQERIWFTGYYSLPWWFLLLRQWNRLRCVWFLPSRSHYWPLQISVSACIHGVHLAQHLMMVLQSVSFRQILMK